MMMAIENRDGDDSGDNGDNNGNEDLPLIHISASRLTNLRNGNKQHCWHNHLSVHKDFLKA